MYVTKDLIFPALGDGNLISAVSSSPSAAKDLIFPALGDGNNTPATSWVNFSGRI